MAGSGQGGRGLSGGGRGRAMRAAARSRFAARKPDVQPWSSFFEHQG